MMSCPSKKTTIHRWGKTTTTTTEKSMLYVPIGLPLRVDLRTQGTSHDQEYEQLHCMPVYQHLKSVATNHVWYSHSLPGIYNHLIDTWYDSHRFLWSWMLIFHHRLVHWWTT